MKGTIEENVSVHGNVDVGIGTVVRQETALRGPVIVGDYSEIGVGARMGPNMSVGNHVRVLGARVENSILLDGVVVDCKERIVDSVIGKDPNNLK